MNKFSTKTRMLFQKLLKPIVVRYPSAEKEPIMEIGFRLETRTKLLFNKLKVPRARFPYSVGTRGGQLGYI